MISRPCCCFPLQTTSEFDTCLLSHSVLYLAHNYHCMTSGMKMNNHLPNLYYAVSTCPRPFDIVWRPVHWAVWGKIVSTFPLMVLGKILILIWNTWRKVGYSCLLYCTALYCTVLYCTVLYCTVLYCTVLYCTVLYCTVLYYTVLYYTILYNTVLYCTDTYFLLFLSYSRYFIVTVYRTIFDRLFEWILDCSSRIITVLIFTPACISYIYFTHDLSLCESNMLKNVFYVYEWVRVCVFVRVCVLKSRNIHGFTYLLHRRKQILICYFNFILGRNSTSTHSITLSDIFVLFSLLLFYYPLYWLPCAYPTHDVQILPIMRWFFTPH